MNVDKDCFLMRMNGVDLNQPKKAHWQLLIMKNFKSHILFARKDKVA